MRQKKRENAEQDPFFEEFYSGDFKIMVEDKEGRNVTEYFLEKTKPLYQSDNISAIKDIMLEERLIVHVYKEKMEPLSTYALEQYKIVSDSFVEYYPDDRYGVVMEFKAELSGGIWYNPNTDQVTRTSAPTFKVQVMQTNGMRITLSCNEIQTGSRVSNGKGYFWATYTITGQAFVSEIGGMDLLYNFGRHTSSFYATP